MSSYEAFASVYDIFMEQVAYDQWLSHIHALWKKYGLEPKTVFDLGCGTGSIALPLAKAGYDVVGVDLSPEMLTEADHKAMEEGLSLRFACQDMTELSLGETADCILSLCDSMNYLTEEGQLAEAFQSIAAHMTAESLFVFDLNTEYKFKEVLGQNVFGSAEEHAAYIWENDYDEEEKINEYYVSFFLENEDGLYERVEEFHYERAYSMEEVAEALEAAGMTLLEVTDGYSFDKPHEKSERLLFTARLK
ncbi:MAG: class I SAM-dependent methyltransferase [Bacillota bacterium]|nr:class I SAM-dependent methyltransferase [Bacillota bacterium]